MRSLLSSLLLLLVGCASYPVKNGFKEVATDAAVTKNPYFSNSAKDYVYKATINVFNKSFGGILIVKKMAEAEHRVAFTTEMGATLFDFSIAENDFRVNRIIPDLDKKLLLKVLQKDFTALVQQQVQVLEQHEKSRARLVRTRILDKKHYYLYKNQALVNIVRTEMDDPKLFFSSPK